MAPGCFSGLWCFRPPPLPNDDETVSPVPTVTTQQSNGGVGDVAAIDMTCPRSHPSLGNVDIRTPVPVQGSLSDSMGALTPAPTEAQPTDPHSPEGNADIPVLAPTEEVPPVSLSSRPTYYLDPAKAKEHVDRIPRFRILVMGRANAGKTTILQRVCSTTDQPEIFNGEGEKVDATKVQGSLMRGQHNIEDELVFRSNPRFVFHDSRGFEAGSEEQFALMKKFVMDRAKAAKLNQRIHAIWFCIPLNENHRLVMAAEKKFFEECDTGHVPVIVLLTKADTLTLDAVEELMSKGASIGDAMKGVAKVEEEIRDNCLVRVKDWLNDRRFAPSDYLTLTGMQQKGAGCESLLTCTANALKEPGLQQLLVSTQQSNLRLCMKYAIKMTLKKCMSKQGDKIKPLTLAFLLSLWFPFEYKQGPHHQYGLKLGDEEDGFYGRYGLVDEVGHWDTLFYDFRYLQDYTLSLDLYSVFTPGNVDDDLIPAISHPAQPLTMPVLSTSMTHSMQYIAEHGIGSILVFEYLYFLLQAKHAQNDLQEYLAAAVEIYNSSGIHAKVNKLIQEAFWKYGEDVETLCPILVSIAEENQLSKVLNREG